MENAVSPVKLNVAGVPEHLRDLVADAVELADKDRADNTTVAYESDFAHFEAWCHSQSTDTFYLDPCPAEYQTVILYLTALAKGKTADGEIKAASTIERRLAGIRWKHDEEGFTSPTGHVRVRKHMKSIRRTLGVEKKKPEPMTTDTARRIVESLDLESLAGLRDRALLLFGYASAFRRSELVGMKVEDLRRAPEGYRVRLGKTKDDQERKGYTVGVPAFPGSELCPVTALDEWLSAAGVTEGFVFRKVTKDGTIVMTKQIKDEDGVVVDVVDAGLTGAWVARLLKRMCKDAGIPEVKMSGHSLRSGHVTTASENDAPDRALLDQTRHKSLETLRGYNQSVAVFRDNSANYLNLDDPTKDEDLP